MPVLIIAIIALIIFLNVVHAVYIIKRMSESIRLKREAKLSIGDGVILRRDKGAKLAYKGLCSYYRKDFAGAINYFKAALEHSLVPHNHAFCMDWLARCYDYHEKPNESLNYSIKAVRAEPASIKALFGLADSYCRRGSFEKAEFYYNSILKYDSGNAAAIFMLGALFMGRGLYDKAEAQFKKALEIDKNFTSAIAELSVLMAFKGNYKQMNVYLEKAKTMKYSDSARLEKKLRSIREMRELLHDS